MERSVSIQAIGTARVDQGRFRIELAARCKEALQGLEGFSHALVVWWAHQVEAREYRNILVLEKPYAKGPDSIGVFATRGPVRPNPIMVTAVPIRSVDADQGVVELYYHDCMDGTPVLDLKPYHPSSDLVRGAATPAWCAHWPKDAESSADFDWAAEIPCMS